MRRVGLLLLLAFVVSLAVVVGGRMSTDAMAVVVGVVCGVAAGIPMSVILMLALHRRDRQAQDLAYSQMSGRQTAASPPVVVIQGGTPSSNAQSPPYYPLHAPIDGPVRRQFRVIGELDE